MLYVIESSKPLDRVAEDLQVVCAILTQSMNPRPVPLSRWTAWRKR